MLQQRLNSFIHSPASKPERKQPLSFVCNEESLRELRHELDRRLDNRQRTAARLARHFVALRRFGRVVHQIGVMEVTTSRPLTTAAFSFLILSSGGLCDPRLHGRRSPACVVIKRKRGYGGAGWDMPAEQPNRLHMTFGRPLRGILVQRLPHFLLEQEPHGVS